MTQAKATPSNMSGKKPGMTPQCTIAPLRATVTDSIHRKLNVLLCSFWAVSIPITTFHTDTL